MEAMSAIVGIVGLKTGELFYNRYISASVTETDQVKEPFAFSLGEMYPVRLCLYVLPGASMQKRKRALGRASVTMFGGVRFFFECPPKQDEFATF